MYELEILRRAQRSLARLPQREYERVRDAILALAAETTYRSTNTFPPSYPRQQRAE